MGELVINRHNFEVENQRLAEFANQEEKEVQIYNVEIDAGPFGMLNHKVTGVELNNRLEAIRETFIALNNKNIQIIKEFGQIYKTLDLLDKEYIMSIVANVKAIEKTSNDVRAQQEVLSQHNNELRKQQSELDVHQLEIEKNVENTRKMVDVLGAFKKKLEEYKHITDIDKIWEDCQTWHDDISRLMDTISRIDEEGKACASDIIDVGEALEHTKGKVELITKTLSEQCTAIRHIESFVEEVESIAHLNDIDEMWDALSDAHTSLKKIFAELDSIKATIENHQNDIAKVLEFVETVSKYDHLKDVDAMWDKTEEHDAQLKDLLIRSNETIIAVTENQKNIFELADYKNEISAIVHLKDVDNLWDSNENHSDQIEELKNQSEETKASIKQNKELFDQSLAEEKEKTDVALQQLGKKIKYAYWIAGGSLALAIAELAVILFG